MKTITFLTPTGEDIENPSDELLQELIFQRGDEYWQLNAGDAGFWYDESEQRKAEITLISKEPFGFRMSFLEYKNNQDYVLSENGKTKNLVIVYVGGEPIQHFTNEFVSKQIVWQAIEYFLKTGERDPSLTWETAELVETA